MKILRPGNGAAGIFFPIGSPKLGGTCEYASDLCLKKCYALDKEYNQLVNVPEKEKKEIYNFFVVETTVTLCSKIIKEMDELQMKVLGWFSSGDCLNKDVNKVYQIMTLLNEEGIVQNGFTRNLSLYKKIVDGNILHHIVLTIESLDGHPSSQDTSAGLWAIPDYELGIVELYHGKLGTKSYASCGFNKTVTKFKGKEVEIATNCTGCYHKKLGCFYKMKK